MKVLSFGLYSSFLAYIVPAVPKSSAEPCATMGLYVILCQEASLSCTLPQRLIITISSACPAFLICDLPPLAPPLVVCRRLCTTARILLTVNLTINDNESSHRICKYYWTETDFANRHMLHKIA